VVGRAPRDPPVPPVEGHSLLVGEGCVANAIAAARGRTVKKALLTFPWVG